MDYKYSLEYLKCNEVNKNKRVYTGFTYNCRKCGKEVKCKNVGKTDEGVNKFIITCGCKGKEDE